MALDPEHGWKKPREKTWDTRVLTESERAVYNRRQALAQRIRRQERKIDKAAAELADMRPALKLMDKQLKPIRAAVRKRLGY